jgi:acyl carrier protein
MVSYPDAGIAMTDNEVYLYLTEIFRDVFETQDIVLSRTTTADDVPGWDSMKMVMILMAVEERFGIRFSTREMDSVQCVGDFADCIKAKTLTHS